MLKPVLNMLFEYYDRHNTFFVKIVEGREKIPYAGRRKTGNKKCKIHLYIVNKDED